MDIKVEPLTIKGEYEPEIGPTELVFETVNLPSESNQTRCIAMWSNEETKKFIELYKKFMADVGPYNRFKRKKDMWIEISSHIPSKSAKQCEERLKTILKRKKKGTIEVLLSDGKRKLLDLAADERNEIKNIRKRKISPKADDSSTPYKVWSASETKLLVDLYKSFINEVGPQRKFMHKKDMWAKIAEHFENKDTRQCEQRFNTLFKRKKKCLPKCYAAKARRKTIDFRARHLRESSPLKNNSIPHEEEKGDLRTEDVPKEESVEQERNTAANSDNIELFSLTETLKEIAARKEEGKERRHRERMEAMANLQNILLQMMSASRK